MMKTIASNNVAEQLTMNANPIQEYRKPTDKAFIVLFSIIFLSWIGITIQVLVDPLVVEKNVTVGDQNFLIDSERMELRFSWKFLLCTFLSGMIAMAYIFLLLQPIINHIIIYFALVLVFALIILFFGLALATLGYLFLFYWEFGFILLRYFSFPLLLYLAYQVLIFYCFAKINVKSVFEIIQEACRAILFYPMSMLFGCLMSVLIIMIISLTVFVFGCIPSDHPHVTIYYFIEIFGAIVIATFITNFTQTVVSGFVIDWVWTEDQKSVSHDLIRIHIDRTWRYHMGTICFGSIPLLPNVWAMVQGCCSRSDTSQIAIKDNIFIRLVGQISLIINARDFALIQTSIYGTTYVTSIKASIDLVTQNPKLHLVVTEITSTLVLMGIFLTTLPFKIDEVHFAMYSTPVPFFITLMTAFRALLVNRMIMDNATEGVERLAVNLHYSPTATMYSE